MVGIRGGMDTGEDEQGVYISTIREGGAAYRYGEYIAMVTSLP